MRFLKSSWNFNVNCLSYIPHYHSDIILNVNGILFSKLFWPTVRKNCSSYRDFFFEIWGWRPRICKTFEVTRTMYSNSERLVYTISIFETQCCFNSFLEDSQISYIRKIRIQIEIKQLRSRNLQEKWEKSRDERKGEKSYQGRICMYCIRSNLVWFAWKWSHSLTQFSCKYLL